MYQFNYQYLTPEDKPFVTCIVPEGWLSRNLPTMGGSVVYVDKRDPIRTCTYYVFEFTEKDQTSESFRLIGLNIDTMKNGVSYAKLFDKPASIHCHAFDGHDANNDWCIEVVLLNHLFGSHALSASMQNTYLDYSDVLHIMQMSSEFNFEFGIGNVPADIILGLSNCLSNCKAKSTFVMLFCKQQMFRLAYIDEIVDQFDSVDSVDSSFLIADIAVDQDKILISVLAGR